MPDIVQSCVSSVLNLQIFFFSEFLKNESMFMTVDFFVSNQLKSTHEPGVNGSANVHKESKGP